MRSAAVSGNGTVMKQVVFPLSILLVVLFLSACGSSVAPGAVREPDPVTESDSLREPAVSSPPESDPADPGVSDSGINNEESPETTEEPMMATLKMKIDGRELPVVWEDNESVRALVSLASGSPVTVAMARYGGFEQVGALGTSLPRNNARITTRPGDIVLYAGNQIVVFYGSNSWAYTRLGHITDHTAAQLKDLLGNGDVTLTLSIE